MKDLLLLIDIDGTLLTTNGVAINFMIRAAEEETGSKIKFEIEDYLGKLDPQIVETLLKKGGYSSEEILTNKSKVYDRYLQLLKPALKPEDVTVYSGVMSFMEYITKLNLKFGVLTGNTKAGAKIKLSSVNLDSYFPFGAYGDNAETRPELVPIAVSRANKHYNRSFQKHSIWIIGDSINDITCARENGINCCIVTTGRTDPEKLKAMKPEILIDYLNNPENVINEICRISDI
ncbi:MAG: HAD hydrolase-like protein [Calditrichia bacterium]|nr:HAD hydrolase-like protein [Calditrichia bacterium]